MSEKDYLERKKDVVVLAIIMLLILMGPLLMYLRR